MSAHFLQEDLDGTKERQRDQPVLRREELTQPLYRLSVLIREGQELADAASSRTADARRPWASGGPALPRRSETLTLLAIQWWEEGLAELSSWGLLSSVPLELRLQSVSGMPHSAPASFASRRTAFLRKLFVDLGVSIDARPRQGSVG